MAMTKRRVAVDDTAPAARRAYVREYFGGLDLPAALVGMLTSVALVLMLSGIATAVANTNFSYRDALTHIDQATAWGAIVSLAILIVSFFVGGWAAGRMARFDGMRNGIFAAVLAIVFSIGLAALTAYVGTQYNLVPNLDLSRYVNDSTVTNSSIVAGILALIAMLVSAALGGMWGEHYHRVIDEEMAAVGGTGTVVERSTTVDERPARRRASKSGSTSTSGRKRTVRRSSRRKD